MEYIVSVIISASLRLEYRVMLMTFAIIGLFLGQLGMAMYHLYHGSVLLAWAMLTLGLLQVVVPSWSVFSQASVAHRVRLGDFNMGAALAIRQLFDDRSDDINQIADYLPNQLLKFTSFSVRHLAAGGVVLLAYLTYSCVVGYPIADIDIQEIRSYELVIASLVATVYSWIDLPVMLKALDNMHRKLDGIYLQPATMTVTHHQEQGVQPRAR